MTARPYICVHPRCQKNGRSMYRRLVFDNERGTPTCPNHKKSLKVELVPLEQAQSQRLAA